LWRKLTDFGIAETGHDGNVRSLFAKYRIDHPAASNVRARPATVVVNGHFLTPGILEGVGEDGHRGEVAGVVHALSEQSGGGGAPGGLEGNGAEGVAEDVAEERGLKL
jgi:hypothetical protein